MRLANRSARLTSPGTDRGLDLAAHGYLEQEFLVSGRPTTGPGTTCLTARPAVTLPFTTRILVRPACRPGRVQRCAVYLEPNHRRLRPLPDLVDGGAVAGPLRDTRTSGMTQEPAVLPDLARWDPARYGALRIDAIRAALGHRCADRGGARAGATPLLGGFPVRRQCCCPAGRRPARSAAPSSARVPPPLPGERPPGRSTAMSSASPPAEPAWPATPACGREPGCPATTRAGPSARTASRRRAAERRRVGDAPGGAPPRRRRPGRQVPPLPGGRAPATGTGG